MNRIEPSPTRAERLRPVLLFVGFGLLGVAFSLLLFGRDLLGTPSLSAQVSPNNSELPAFDSLSTPIIAQIPAGSFSGAPQVGDQAPDFALTDLDGTIVSLRDLRGRPIIINFWATWCAPCRLEMPELQAAHHRYQDSQLAILAVNREETAAEVAAYFQELQLTFTPLLDEEAVIANLYQVFNMPTTYFVNPDGLITAVHRGPLSQKLLDDYLGQTMSN